MKAIYDESGVIIHARDILKVYHFTGARRKKYYMYKFVIVKDGELYALHSGHLAPSESEGYYLWASARKDGVLEDTAIVNIDDYPEFRLPTWKSK